MKDTKYYKATFKDYSGEFTEEIELPIINPEQYYKELLMCFNNEEVERYGEKAKKYFRYFVKIKVSTKENKNYCDFSKVRFALQDNKGIYDLMECSCCKKRWKRYGLISSPKKICKGKNYYLNSYKNNL